MHSHPPQVHNLTDYKPSDFLLDHVFLHFDLHEDHALVKAILNLRRNPQGLTEETTLVLDGQAMELKNVLLDGVKLAPGQYQTDEQHLKIFDVPDVFTLETEVRIKPQENTQLSGLYKSRNIFCTQCESHGFRRITYFLDRPDVLTHFTTCITSDKSNYPVLLSNGNLVDSHELADNRHWVKWEDPTRKPCYLFALVAGNLDVIEDVFITQSERAVKLAVYVEPGKGEQATHAMHSLKLAMRWDEDNYGREYDLDMYMVVGVSDFNFGAMENKGLNLFNDKYILAKPEVATDEDYINILAVIGHEYFHNWSGNRVTVRDWFQITLKEGLTVFREHQFTAENTSKTVKRIQEAKTIRNVQFAQDAGPMAHPVYPDSYIEINNFYTVTIYEKGAEIIRMLHTILGPSLFRKAMDIYFTRNDGNPVTVEEFVQAMESASGLDLTQFRRWYKQSGTPVLTIKDDYDAKSQTYNLQVMQSCPPTPGQPVKENFHIPLAIGLIGEDGQEIALERQGEPEWGVGSQILNIKQHTESFKFFNVTSKPVPSLLRDFSAPVKLQYNYSEEDLIFLMLHDTDAFNRWDASQQLALKIMLRLIENYEQELEMRAPYQFLDVLGNIFENESLDKALIAEMLILPAETYLIEQMGVADVDAIHDVREWLRKHIALKLKPQLLAYYHKHNTPNFYTLDPASVSQRRLKNLALAYLAHLGDSEFYSLCLAQFHAANNMTDVMGALQALNNIDCDARKEALFGFYYRWQHESLVVDKWFSLQAQSSLPNTLQVVKSFTKHPAFDIKNPNRIRAIIGAFCTGNPVNFHDITGEGYTFLADHVLEIDHYNSQMSARLLEPLTRWKKFDTTRQALMKQELERIAAKPKLSSDLYEIVTKSLD